MSHVTKLTQPAQCSALHGAVAWVEWHDVGHWYEPVGSSPPPPSPQMVGKMKVNKSSCYMLFKQHSRSK